MKLGYLAYGEVGAFNGKEHKNEVMYPDDERRLKPFGEVRVISETILKRL